MLVATGKLAAPHADVAVLPPYGADWRLGYEGSPGGTAISAAVTSCWKAAASLGHDVRLNPHLAMGDTGVAPCDTAPPQHYHIATADASPIVLRPSFHSTSPAAEAPSAPGSPISLVVAGIQPASDPTTRCTPRPQYHHQVLTASALSSARVASCPPVLNLTHTAVRHVRPGGPVAEAHTFSFRGRLLEGWHKVPSIRLCMVVWVYRVVLAG